VERAGEPMPRGTRMSSDVFRSVLDKARQRLVLEGADAADFQHNVIRGDERAASLAKFFRERLPDQFGVEKGEAVDCFDRRTGQLDFVIYDRARCAPIRVGNENLLLPCEALYCVVEVKTLVTQRDLDSSYVAAGKVRALHPFKKPFIAGRQDGSHAKDDRDRCLYVVFGYASDLANNTQWTAKEYQRMSLSAKAAAIGVDFVDRLFVLDRGIINPQKPAGKWETGNASSVFLESYLHVVNFLGREAARRKPVDWQMYAARSAGGWKAIT
ncbi:MAG: DUF6602 domain-containing protein, partial [Candidatus Micrarchaeaceae archaeon]